MKRYGFVVRLREGREEEYRRLHQAVWPEVLEQIRRSSISDYTIFLRDGLLFGSYKYSGDDHAGDMRRMAEDPATQKWWDLTDPCQEPIPSAREGEWWAEMEEVFHFEG